jgi:hypothetical protein
MLSELKDEFIQRCEFSKSDELAVEDHWGWTYIIFMLKEYSNITYHVKIYKLERQTWFQWKPDKFDEKIPMKVDYIFVVSFWAKLLSEYEFTSIL